MYDLLTNKVLLMFLTARTERISALKLLVNNNGYTVKTGVWFSHK